MAHGCRYRKYPILQKKCKIHDSENHKILSGFMGTYQVGGRMDQKQELELEGGARF